jgi:hypothetical protein
MNSATFTAKGSFTVKTTPAGESTRVGNTSVGKYLVEKIFTGDLQATSKFEMHTAVSDNGAAAYVAIEIVTGTLQDKSGSFVLIHQGTRTKTSQSLTITVAPGLATGELTGLEGTFTIDVVGKEHFYTMAFSLPA